MRRGVWSGVLTGCAQQNEPITCQCIVIFIGPDEVCSSLSFGTRVTHEMRLD